MSILDWPAYLRSWGVGVAEHNNWRSNRPLGDLPSRPYLVWHHDASPAGPSPGALDWIINAYNSQDASAQIWVGYDGVWHFIGSGIAWHTGAVLPGMPNNYNAVGVETDETTGENWSPALLDSLRRGTAAIAAAEGYDPASWLHFHKTICSPPGRKSDPSGLDLAAERGVVRALMSGKNPARPVPGPADPSVPGGADPKDWFDMATEADLRRIVREELAETYRMVGVLTGAFAPDQPTKKVAAEQSIGDQVKRSVIDEDGHQLGQTIADISSRAAVLVDRTAPKA